MGSAHLWGLKEVVAAGCGPVVKLWAPEAPNNALKINEGTPVYCLDFSHNNRVLAVGGDKGQAVLYSGKGAAVHTGCQPVGNIPRVPSDAADSITCIKFAPNDSFLAGGCTNGTVHVWSLKEEKERDYPLPALHGSITSIAIHPNLTALASSSASGQVVLSNFPNGAKLRSLLHKGTRAGCLGFAPQQPNLLCGAKGSGQLLVWDTDQASQAPEEYNVHRANVTGCTFVPNDANLLVSCGEDGLIACTDRRSKRLAWESAGRVPLSAVSMKWDGSQVAVGTGWGRVQVHDIRQVTSSMVEQEFTNELPVTALCWQNQPPNKAHRKSGAAGAAAAAAASADTNSGAAAASNSKAAAPGSVSSTAAAAGNSRRAAAAATGAAAAPPAGHTAGAPPRPGGASAAAAAVGPHKTPLVVPGWDNSTPKSLGVTRTASSSSEADYQGLRVVSPMRPYSSPFESDMHSGLTGVTPPAAAGGSVHTPSDSAVSGAGYKGPAMFTPGLVQLGNLGGGSATPFAGPTAAPDVTPVSRLAASSTAAAPPAPETLYERRTAAAAQQSAAAPGPNSNRGGAADAGGASQRGRVSSDAGNTPSRGSAGGAKDHGAGAATVLSATAAAPPPSKSSRPSAGGGASAGGAAGISSSQRRKFSDAGAAAAAPASSKAHSSTGNGSSSMGGAPALPSTADAAADGSVMVVAASRSTAATSSSKVAAVEGVGGIVAAGQQHISSSSSRAVATSTVTGVGGAVPASTTSAAAGAGAVGGGMPAGVLREDVFKAYIDARMNAIEEAVANMHVGLHRQFAQAQADLALAMTSLAARQDQLAEAVTQLNEAVQTLSISKQQHHHHPQPSVAMIPWI